MALREHGFRRSGVALVGPGLNHLEAFWKQWASVDPLAEHHLAVLAAPLGTIEEVPGRQARPCLTTCAVRWRSDGFVGDLAAGSDAHPVMRVALLTSRVVAAPLR
jgi:hypothetical protein